MSPRRWNIPSGWTRHLQVGLGAFGVCLLFLLGLFFGWTARIEQGLFYTWSWAGTRVHGLYETAFASRSLLQQERDHYQTLSGSLAKDAAEVATLREAIKNLEDALRYQPHDTQKPVLARILSRTDEPDELIVVDQGTEEGIQLGDAAYIHDGHLIGIVEDVWPHTCRIRLIGDANSHIPASILGQNIQTIGIVDGQGGYLLMMRFIPHDQPIAVGQVVMTSGLDGHLPAGLVLGTITEVIQEDRALFQEAMIEPVFPLDQETQVILLPRAREEDTP